MKLITELHRSARGPVMNNEDWWRLVIDGEAIYVEHEWDHVDVRASGAEPEQGKSRRSVQAFLDEGGQGEAHRKLRAWLEGMFPGGFQKDAASA